NSWTCRPFSSVTRSAGTEVASTRVATIVRIVLIHHLHVSPRAAARSVWKDPSIVTGARGNVDPTKGREAPDPAWQTPSPQLSTSARRTPQHVNADGRREWLLGRRVRGALRDRQSEPCCCGAVRGGAPVGGRRRTSHVEFFRASAFVIAVPV